MLWSQDFLSQPFNHRKEYTMPLLFSSRTPNHVIIFPPSLHNSTGYLSTSALHTNYTLSTLSIAPTTWTIWFISQLTVQHGLTFVQPPASCTGNRLWGQNSANEPSVVRDLLHGTIYLIIFSPSLTLPVLNDSSKLFCFLHALIIELCNVYRTIL